jgi:hypothetical protein
MNDFIIIYILIGCLWAWWLEYYTTQNEVLGRYWVMRERIFHSVLWPVSLLTFLYEFFRYFFDNNDE